jgi:hypothetical protein
MELLWRSPFLLDIPSAAKSRLEGVNFAAGLKSCLFKTTATAKTTTITSS